MKAKYNLRSSPCKSWIENIVVVLLLACLLSCTDMIPQNGKKLSVTDNKKLTRFLSAMSLAPVNEKMLLVIPTHGCGSCIKAALEFTARHEKNTRLTTVVSSYSTKSYTLLTHRFKVDRQKIVFDKEALFLKNSLISIYPVLYQAGNNGAIYAAELDATNIQQVLTGAGLEF